MSRRIHGPVVNLEIIDGKVWLQADITDLRIAERLEETGIPQSDIVLGFQLPHVRLCTRNRCYLEHRSVLVLKNVKETGEEVIPLEYK